MDHLHDLTDNHEEKTIKEMSKYKSRVESSVEDKSSSSRSDADATKRDHDGSLTMIDAPDKIDYVVGGEGKLNHRTHPGNKHFRELLELGGRKFLLDTNTSTSIKTSRSITEAKTKICNDLIKIHEGLKGRFLQYDAVREKFWVMDDRATYKKVESLFIETLGDVRKNLNIGGVWRRLAAGVHQANATQRFLDCLLIANASNNASAAAAAAAAAALRSASSPFYVERPTNALPDVATAAQSLFLSPDVATGAAIPRLHQHVLSQLLNPEQRSNDVAAALPRINTTGVGAMSGGSSVAGSGNLTSNCDNTSNEKHDYTVTSSALAGDCGNRDKHKRRLSSTVDPLSYSASPVDTANSDVQRRHLASIGSMSQQSNSTISTSTKTTDTRRSSAGNTITSRAMDKMNTIPHDQPPQRKHHRKRRGREPEGEHSKNLLQGRSRPHRKWTRFDPNESG